MVGGKDFLWVFVLFFSFFFLIEGTAFSTIHLIRGA